jgi:hypothetical protein
LGKNIYLYARINALKKEQKLEAISLKFDLQGRALNSAWKRSLKSVNAMGRSMASKTRKEEKVSSFVSNMDSAIDDLDNGIRLENNDDLRRALDIFIVLREEMEVILGKPKSDTESSGSDDDSDETADDDTNSDGVEEDDD